MSLPRDITYSKPTNLDDYTWLYALLRERLHRVGINISHRRLPSFDEHVRFWKSNPYRMVEIVRIGKRVAGYWCISNLGEIGIYLFEDCDTKEMSGAMLDRAIDVSGLDEFLVNVNPGNLNVIGALVERGFTVCQHTYRGTR